MKGFYKEFVIYGGENFPIQPLIGKVRNLNFLIKRHDLLSVFIKNIREERELKKIIKGYNYKEFQLEKDKVPIQNYRNISVDELIIRRKGPPDRRSIIIGPGISFGYDHPATILTVKKLIYYKSLFKDRRVLDVGIGSGILSLVMAKKGAKKVIGVDICPFVIKEAIKNVRKNHIKFKRIKVILKDVSALKQKFSFIVANVPINVHEVVSNAVKRLLLRDGAILLGGIMKENIRDIKKIYNDFNEVDLETLENWSVILLKPNS